MECDLHSHYSLCKHFNSFSMVTIKKGFQIGNFANGVINADSSMPVVLDSWSSKRFISSMRLLSFECATSKCRVFSRGYSTLDKKFADAEVPKEEQNNQCASLRRRKHGISQKLVTICSYQEAERFLSLLRVPALAHGFFPIFHQSIISNDSGKRNWALHLQCAVVMLLECD